MSTRGKLLLITNLDHDDRSEDLLLAERLAERFDLSIASPNIALPLLANRAVDGCLIRNAWPGRLFKAAFAAIESLTVAHGIGTYNPFVPGRRGPVENKAYLVDLFERGYPVIPTYASTEAMVRAGYAPSQAILAKPVDGCSSEGIVATSLAQAPGGDFVYQPRVAFDHEVSFYVIDGHYAWAMRSRGPSMDDRWYLAPLEASASDVDWAMTFVRWNGLPYGLQRIDAARLDDGRLLLMEVEDSTPFLSLADLSVPTRDAAMAAIVESVYQNLCLNAWGPSQRALHRCEHPVADLVAGIRRQRHGR